IAYLESAMPASVPTGMAISVQIEATASDRRNALRRSAAMAILAYHCSENPSGGNSMILPEVNEAPSTTMVGADSTTRTAITMVQMTMDLLSGWIISCPS